MKTTWQIKWLQEKLTPIEIGQHCSAASLDRVSILLLYNEHESLTSAVHTNQSSAHNPARVTRRDQMRSPTETIANTKVIVSAAYKEPWRLAERSTEVELLVIVVASALSKF